MALMAAVLALAVAACGSNGLQIGDGGSGNGDGGGNGDGQTDSWWWPPTEGGTGDGPIEACAAETTRAQQIPLDIYMMLDKSGSMDDDVQGGTKWTVVRNALANFLAQPSLAGVSVGLQYFPLGSTCNANDFATPAVEIAPLPGVGTAIAQSLVAQSPNGNTPTSAALQGAINHAKAWATAHPDHAVIVILATDGQPTSCDPTDTVTIGSTIAAPAASGTPKILTFVIGVGNLLQNLNDIASAGGTNQAFIVDTNGNVGQQFLDALNAIRGAALGCVYRLPSPDGGTPDYDKVNVQYTPGGGGAAQVFPFKNSLADCPAGGDGWYYDNPSAPTLINLCPATCDKVKADTSGTVDVLLGCKTILE
jgi:uncharacterized protein YegL